MQKSFFSPAVAAACFVCLHMLIGRVVGQDATPFVVSNQEAICNATQNCIAFTRIIRNLPVVFRSKYGDGGESVSISLRPDMCRDIGYMKTCTMVYRDRCAGNLSDTFQSTVDGLKRQTDRVCPRNASSRKLSVGILLPVFLTFVVALREKSI